MADVQIVDLDPKLSVDGTELIEVQNAAGGLGSSFHTPLSNLIGADGPPGPDGADGASATVAAGTTTTLAAGAQATVVNVGTTEDAVFNFGIPQGIKGDTGTTGGTGTPGAAATIAVGTTTTGAPGSSAAVTNSGTSSAATFNFTVPAGQTGAQGTPGTPGTAGQGVPAGGASGQILAKTTASDYNTGWINPPSGGGGSGTVTEVLGTLPIVIGNTPSAVPNVSINPATNTLPGSMSGPDKAKLDAITGTNTGNQTITLTGDVTGSGTGSFAATIAAAAVTLAKMANMATGSLFYRKTAGSGAPEIQTLATVKTDLGLTGTNSGDQTTTGTAPIVVATGTTNPAISISPATTSLPGSMSAADKQKLNTTQVPFAQKGPTDPVVLFLDGQSNAGGWSDPTPLNATSMPINNRVFEFTGTTFANSPDNAVWQVLNPAKAYMDPSVAPARGLGYCGGYRGSMAYGAADLIQKATGRDVFVIITYKGGAPISYWSPTVAPPTTEEDMWLWSNQWITTALTSLVAGTRGAPYAVPSATHVDIHIWEQGASNALWVDGNSSNPVLSDTIPNPVEYAKYQTAYLAMKQAIEDPTKTLGRGGQGGWAKPFYTNHFLVEYAKNGVRNPNGTFAAGIGRLKVWDGISYIDLVTDERTRVVRSDMVGSLDNLHFYNADLNQLGTDAGYSYVYGPTPNTNQVRSAGTYLSSDVAGSNYAINSLRQISPTVPTADITAIGSPFINIPGGTSLNFASAAFTPILKTSGTLTFKQSANVIDAGWALDFQTTVNNIAGTPANFGPIGILRDLTIFSAANAGTAMGFGGISVSIAPTFTRTGSGTLAGMHYFNMAGGSFNTGTTISAQHYSSRTTQGTLYPSSLISFFAETPVAGVPRYAALKIGALAEPPAGQWGIYQDNELTNRLFRTSLYPQAADYTLAEPPALFSYNTNKTSNFSNAAFPTFLSYSGTHTLAQTGNFISAQTGLSYVPTIKNATGVAMSLGPMYSLFSSVAYQTDNAVVGINQFGVSVDISSSAAFTRTQAGLGTLTGCFINNQAGATFDLGSEAMTYKNYYALTPGGTANGPTSHVSFSAGTAAAATVNFATLASGQGKTTFMGGRYFLYQGDTFPNRTNAPTIRNALFTFSGATAATITANMDIVVLLDTSTGTVTLPTLANITTGYTAAQRKGLTIKIINDRSTGGTPAVVNVGAGTTAGWSGTTTITFGESEDYVFDGVSVWY